MVGDICVGKTAIFSQIQNPGNYSPDLSTATVSATFAQVKVVIEEGESGDPTMIQPGNKKTVNLQLWDTAGDERLKNLTKQYFQGADAAIVVYDVCNPESLTTAESWVQDVKENCPPDVAIYLAGNKIDLYEKQEVPRRDGQKLAKDQSLEFYETSAVENTGIPELFKSMATKLAKKKRARNPTVKLDSRKSTEPKKKGCC